MDATKIELDKRDAMRIISLLEREVGYVGNMTEHGRHCERLRDMFRSMFIRPRPQGKTPVEVFQEERKHGE